VADAHLGHDRDRHRLLDALDHARVGHASDAAVLADVGGNTLERHDRNGARGLGDLCLIGRDDVHDHAALEHLGEARLDAQCGRLLHGNDSSGAGSPANVNQWAIVPPPDHPDRMTRDTARRR
jgi:hypothetical protein